VTPGALNVSGRRHVRGSLIEPLTFDNKCQTGLRVVEVQLHLRNLLCPRHHKHHQQQNSTKNIPTTTNITNRDCLITAQRWVIAKILKAKMQQQQPRDDVGDDF